MDPIERLTRLLESIDAMRFIDHYQRWWDVDYIEDDVARNVIRRMHDAMNTEGVSFETPDDVINFVKGHSDMDGAFQFVENLVHHIAAFDKWHKRVTWKTIDESHANFMYDLLTWSGATSIEKPKLYNVFTIRGREFIVVGDPENKGDTTSECNKHHDVYQQQSQDMQRSFVNTTELNVIDLPGFVSSCRPAVLGAVNRLAPNIQRVISDRLRHLSLCVTYAGPDRFIEGSLGRLCKAIIRAFISLHSSTVES